MKRQFSKEDFLNFLNENVYNYEDVYDSNKVVTNEKVTDVIYSNKIQLDSGYRAMEATSLLQIVELKARKSLNEDWINKKDVRNTNTNEHYDWIVPFCEYCFREFQNGNYNENDNIKNICHSTLKNKHLREEFVKTFQDAKTIIGELYKNATEEEKVVLNKMKNIYNLYIVNEIPNLVKKGIEYEKQYFNTYQEGQDKEPTNLNIDYNKKQTSR